MKTKFRPDIQVQIYAMVAWNGKTMEEAEKIAEDAIKKYNGDEDKAFDELDTQVYAKTSILTALEGIQRHEQELQGNDKYMAVMKILEEIHDKWVKDHPAKYQRKTPQQSIDQLYQHLQTEMIGVDEVAKDLMFLAPFLEFEVGKMQEHPYGLYIPCKEVSDAYDRFAKKFFDEYKIVTIEDLKEGMPEIITGYQFLLGEDDTSKARVEFMLGNVDTLAREVVERQSKEMFQQNEDEKQ